MGKARSGKLPEHGRAREGRSRALGKLPKAKERMLAGKPSRNLRKGRARDEVAKFTGVKPRHDEGRQTRWQLATGCQRQTLGQLAQGCRKSRDEVAEERLGKLPNLSMLATRWRSSMPRDREFYTLEKLNQAQEKAPANRPGPSVSSHAPWVANGDDQHPARAISATMTAKPTAR